MDLRVNLGCGPVFIEANEWVNYDYQPVSASVERADLLKPLPIADSTCDMVYSSHFIEHIPRRRVKSFLAECFRVLKPGGVLRLVLPDFEEMCREYLYRRENGDHSKADFLVIEIIDQCVRMEPGGELGRFYQSLSADPGGHVDLISYLRERNGEDLGLHQCDEYNEALAAAPLPIYKDKAKPPLGPRFKRLSHRVRTLPSRFCHKLRRLFFRLTLDCLPTAFREQNVSLAAVGEKHHWLWDFTQIKDQLMAVGFSAVSRATCLESRVVDFPFFPLDIDQNGLPRKGRESMYVEAQKPC